MRASRILLASLALLLLCLVLANEARRYPDDDDVPERAPHHKHRHRHELQTKWPSTGSKKRVSSNNEEDDYYDDNSDYEDYLDEGESEEEEYKDRRAGRSHSPKRTGSNHRRYPPPPRYHHRGSHHVGSARGHEARAHDRLGTNHHRAGSRGTGYRKRYEDEDSEEESDYDRHRRRYDDSDEEDDLDNEPTGYYHNKHKSPARRRVAEVSDKSRRSRYEPRKDWRYKLDDEEDDYGYDADDEAEESEELDNRSRKHSARKSFRQPHHEDESAKPLHRRSAYNKLDEWMKRVRNSSRSHDRRNSNPEPQENVNHDEDDADDDDELELWKDEEPDDNKELDNDFYKNDESASLKSFDDIIRKLTEERITTTTTSTTAAPVKRDYRNTFYDSRRNRSGAIRHENIVDSAGRKKSLQDEEDEEEEEEEAQADANMVSLLFRLSAYYMLLFYWKFSSSDILLHYDG